MIPGSEWQEEMAGRKWQPTPVFLPGNSHRQRSWRATGRDVPKSRTGRSEEMTTTAETVLPLGRHLVSSSKLDVDLSFDPAVLEMWIHTKTCS